MDLLRRPGTECRVGLPSPVLRCIVRGTQGVNKGRYRALSLTYLSGLGLKEPIDYLLLVLGIGRRENSMGVKLS